MFVNFDIFPDSTVLLKDLCFLNFGISSMCYKYVLQCHLHSNHAFRNLQCILDRSMFYTFYISATFLRNANNPKRK